MGTAVVATVAPKAIAPTAVKTAAADTAGSKLAGASSISTGLIKDPLTDMTNVINTMVGWAQGKKTRRQNAKQFDRTFKENQRRFGLEFALSEWSTRKGLSLQEAQQLYNQSFSTQQLGFQGAQTRESLKGASVSRRGAEDTFKWAREDRAKQEKMAKAYSKGVFSGMAGRV